MIFNDLHMSAFSVNPDYFAHGSVLGKISNNKNICLAILLVKTKK